MPHVPAASQYVITAGHAVVVGSQVLHASPQSFPAHGSIGGLQVKVPAVTHLPSGSQAVAAK